GRKRDPERGRGDDRRPVEPGSRSQRSDLGATQPRRPARGLDRRRAHDPSRGRPSMIAATPWAATNWRRRMTLTPLYTYGGDGEGTDALGDACGERFPSADAARGPAEAVRGSTKSSRRLFGEGGCRKCRMGRPEGRPGKGNRRPSEEVGPRGSPVQVNRS